MSQQVSETGVSVGVGVGEGVGIYDIDVDTVSFDTLICTGKVRDIYGSHKYPNLLLLRHSDRLSAFDKIWCDIRNKGKVLNRTSAWWFEKSRHIIDNHLISVINDTDMIVKKCTVIPIEVVVRGYITGTTKTSLWTVYNSGKREYCGTTFSDGLIKNQQLSGK